MLTGEPYAGDPHVWFGGRGGASQCAVPTPIGESIPNCKVDDSGSVWTIPAVSMFTCSDSGSSILSLFAMRFAIR